MAKENGTWIMRGVKESDPRCLHTAEELMDYVDQVGFLPLFQNKIPGFSVEERTVPAFWWSDNEERDPWSWRIRIAQSGRIAYGKFFDKKAGFISLKWLPDFANVRRDGYDFDARWDDGLATRRAKRVMDLFRSGEELFSYEIKQRAGFHKEGEKNFEGVMAELQMQTYLVVHDFRRRLNRQGLSYGWHVARYAPPESIWGYDLVARAYDDAPEVSRERILRQLQAAFPAGEARDFKRLLR